MSGDYTFKNEGSEEISVLPVLGYDTVFPDVLLGLGAFTCGKTVIHRLHDLWSFTQNYRLQTTRTDAVEKARLFFGEYGAGVGSGQEKNLFETLKPLTYEPDYWEMLKFAGSLYFFMYDHARFHGAIFKTTKGSKTIFKNNAVYDGDEKHCMAFLSVGHRLASGAYLDTGEAITTPSGHYAVICQSGKKRVALVNHHQKEIWALPFEADDDWDKEGYLEMELGGALSYKGLKNGAPHRFWTNGVTGHHGSYAALGSDCVLRTYAYGGKETWASPAPKFT